MDVKNKIVVNQNKTRSNCFVFTSSNSFFYENAEVIVFVDEYSVSIKKISIDYNGKSLKVRCINKKGIKKHYQFTVYSEFLKVGHFMVDQEESTEDELIIYLD